jgi:hypothetical protein
VGEQEKPTKLKREPDGLGLVNTDWLGRGPDNQQRPRPHSAVHAKPLIHPAQGTEHSKEPRHGHQDVALLQHHGSQDSPHAVLGLPRSIDRLMRSTEQDGRIRKALKGMVIHREDGILILDKTLGDLANVEVRVISQIADRKRIPHSTLNTQVIDFACDFGFSTSGKAGGGHYRKGYTRAAVASLLPLFADTSGATLMGLDDVFQVAFDTKHSPSKLECEAYPAG